MLETILKIIEKILEAWDNYVSSTRDKQRKQAGIDAAQAEAAKAEAVAQKKLEEVAKQGQTDEDTIKSLNDGTF